MKQGLLTALLAALLIGALALAPATADHGNRDDHQDRAIRRLRHRVSVLENKAQNLNRQGNLQRTAVREFGDDCGTAPGETKNAIFSDTAGGNGNSVLSCGDDPSDNASQQ